MGIKQLIVAELQAIYRSIGHTGSLIRSCNNTHLCLNESMITLVHNKAMKFVVHKVGPLFSDPLVTLRCTEY